jgi:hypothetical protein
MPRSANTVNKKVFMFLKNMLIEEGYADFQKSVYISTTTDDQKWLKDATANPNDGYGKLNCLENDNGLKFGDFYYNGERYIVVNKNLNFEIDSSLFEFEEQNSGVFILALWSGLISVKEDKIAELYEYYLFNDSNTDKSLNFNEFGACFEEFSLIKTKSTITNEFSLSRVASLIINEKAKYLHQNRSLYVDFSYQSISYLMVNGVSSIPFDIVFNGLSHFNNPKFLFLDLYRALERLYSRSYVLELNSLLETNINHDKLNKCVEKATGWRPSEDTELKGLISKLQSSTIINLYNELLEAKSLDLSRKMIKDEETELDALIETGAVESSIQSKREKNVKSKAKIIGDRIYKIRNSMVHYRVIFDDYIKLDDVYVVNSVMCRLVNDIYSKFDDTFD